MQYRCAKFIATRYLQSAGERNVRLSRMPKYLKYFISALLVGFSSHSAGYDFLPAQGWILVSNGNIADVRAAIIEYDQLVKEVEPRAFAIELHPQSDGKLAVLLPNGFPAYDLANMTGWLSSPPSQLGVYDAVAWITSPRDGVKYYLEPEIANTWGDTLIGSSTEGLSIRVYLPETGVSKISTPRPYKKEPIINRLQNPIKISITLDTNTDFGNQNFVINSPNDHTWRP